ELYQITRDQTYARRAVLILDAFARHYPGFLVSADWPHRPKGFVLEPPYPNGGGKWGRWASSEVPSDVVYAYDWIHDSGELERLSDELGVDVGARIENDFFRGCIRQNAFTGPTYGNASPSIYQGYATMGRVMGDPSLVHEAVRRSVKLFEIKFFVDGFWCEGSVGYHQMTMSGMAGVFNALRGYSDPPGYVDPEDGARFDDLDLERDIPIIGKARRIAEICRYPDGRTLTVHDNWAYFRNLVVPERSESTLLAGVGHGWLGAGEGGDQIQAHLHFSGGYGHEHADNLNLTVFAKGMDLLPDVGYTHTRHRAWSTSTLCHNTVVIDETRQYTRGDQGESDGRLTAFEPSHDALQWIEAHGEYAYPGLAQVYGRTLMLVNASDSDSYVVDLFRVAGGAQHDWSLRGNADHEGSVTVNVPVEPFGSHLLPGVEVRYPQGEADRGDAEGRNTSYAYFQNVSRGTVDADLTVSFAISESAAGVRTHLPGAAGAEVFLGDAMCFRRAEENDALQDGCRMPVFLLRRAGDTPLASLFAAVHEPFDGSPFVDGVSLDLDDGRAVALSVRHHGVVDHIVRRIDGGSAVEVGEIRLDGDLGFVRERDGVPEAMGIWGGKELRCAGHVLTAGGTLEGEVVATERAEDGHAHDALIVEGDLPTGDSLRGATAIATFGDGTAYGCRVSEVRARSGRQAVVLEDDPGFAIENGDARHLFFPMREIPGEVTYRIRTSAYAEVSEGTVESVGKAGLTEAR
ncbi:MAG: heparinase II/III family protein, partial [Candidatus Latescibacteria bacterium]|nr:heparinase II/III family protein [Candidatus Latescibacterota bacterium]